MSQTDTLLTPRSRFWFGLTFVAFGIMPMLATFDIGRLGTDDINGPPWLGLATGGVFVAAGLAVMAGPERPVFNGIQRYSGDRGSAQVDRDLLLLTLAPILLPVVLFLFARGGLEAVMTRLGTGAWPRNEGFIAKMKAKRAQDRKPE